jgi:hypothetical protein
MQSVLFRGKLRVEGAVAIGSSMAMTHRSLLKQLVGELNWNVGIEQ